ncbi:MerR family transcriptional regulator [Halobacillus sp. ACCC02827]|uniref:MerR family transcriptional regulator n=1 Tax=Bacillaceae TaxID=186817 RepID=UPI0003F851FF|nr:MULTISPECIES: MerR family transcriptional regulator [Bacillaceae]QHT45286.1 MerR family transcriptional regulator [Bacillus sp. SB49]WJE16067.1 MerR family transcriptional regulator [Halobacillus sp. ACCC02827]
MMKIKEVADLAGCSVRTLHHYDHIGLLSPRTIASNGYRLYGESEIARLQQILFFREMDLSLVKIQQILDDPEFDERKALAHHRYMLVEKRHRLDRMIESVDRTLASIQGGTVMENKDRLEPFDSRSIEEHQKKYEQEVNNRWGNTAAYKESARKTKSYSEEDWKRMKQDMDAIDRHLVSIMDKGPEDAEVQKWIGKKRQHITDYFYECTLEIFRGLADMYVNDERFRSNLEKWREGYPAFLNDAIVHYCNVQRG